MLTNAPMSFDFGLGETTRTRCLRRIVCAAGCRGNLRKLEPRGGSILRLVPLFPFNLSNYVLGLTRIPVSHYVIATFVCMAPGAVAYTWLGHAGRGALTGEADAIHYGLLALGLLAAIGVLPRLLRRMRDPPVWIEPIELKRRLDDREAIIVVDVRGPEEFSGVLGHIPEARNLPMPELAHRLSELKRLKGEPLVLVCLTDKRSAKAAALMRTAGFRNISVLHGGMQQWNESKLPVAYQRSDDAADLS
jgi:rhodanese-related sulfurtransferase